MGEFVRYFGLMYIAAVLLLSGIGHVVRLTSFRELIDEQRVLPARLAGVIAVAVCALELVAGAAALVALADPANGMLRTLVFIGAAGLGAAFWVYLRQLLRQPGLVRSCGCSPLSAPLTRVSVVPAIGLLLAALGGLAVVGQTTAEAEGLPILLPSLWGATFAAIALLYPASVLRHDHA